jgi:hypothetical protein
MTELVEPAELAPVLEGEDVLGESAFAGGERVGAVGV